MLVACHEADVVISLTRNEGSPLSSAGIAGPLTMTVPTIKTMLIKATALAFDRFSIDLYSDSG